MSNFTIPLAAFPTSTDASSGITVAGAPTGVVATVTGSTQASIAFIPPVSDGGSAITGYTVTSSPGNITATGSASPITVTGLTAGTAYTFTVSAINSVGTGPASVPSASVTTWAVAGAPTSVSVSNVGDTSQSVEFTAPASNGGTEITSYTAVSNPGGITTNGVSSPLVVVGLTPGTSYSYTVYATNAVGNSTPSTASNTLQVGIPSVPTNPTATVVSDTEISVAFTEPTLGAPFTNFTVTSTPGNLTGTGTTSPVVVPGLTPRTDYTFTVVATNAIGNSVASTSSSSIRTLGVPDAPINVVATRGLRESSVDFTEAAENGGSAVTGFTVITYQGASLVSSTNGTTSPILVTGLADNTSYTYKVTATNIYGTSSSSTASSAVLTFKVPDAPTSVAAAANAVDSMSVSFVPPVDNGGTAITEYTVTSTPGNIVVQGAASPLVITGLTHGTSYTFKVKATSAVGTGAESIASSAATAKDVPGTPTGVIAAAIGAHTIAVSFSAPEDTGGDTITSYTVYANQGGLTFTGASSPINATDLLLGVNYAFTVRATNSMGTGFESASSNSTTTSPTTVLTPIGTNSFRVAIPANTVVADAMWAVMTGCYDHGWYQHDPEYYVIKSLNQDGTTWKYLRFILTGTDGNASVTTEVYETWNATTHVGVNRAGPSLTGQTVADYKKTAFNLSSASSILIYVYINPRWLLIGSDVGDVNGMGVGGIIHDTPWSPADYRSETSGSSVVYNPVLGTYPVAASASYSHTYCQTQQSTNYTGMSGVIEFAREGMSQNSTVPCFFWTHTGWWIDDNNPKPQTYDANTESQNLSWWNTNTEARTANVIGYMPRNTAGQLGTAAGVQATSLWMKDTQSCYLRTPTSTIPTNLFSGQNPIFDIGCKQASDNTFLGMVYGIKPSRPTSTLPAISAVKNIITDDNFFIVRSGYGNDTVMRPIPSRVYKTRSDSTRNTVSSSSQTYNTGTLSATNSRIYSYTYANRTNDGSYGYHTIYHCRFSYNPSNATIIGNWGNYGYRSSDPWGYGWNTPGYFCYFYGCTSVNYNNTYTVQTYSWPILANTWDFKALFYIPE